MASVKQSPLDAVAIKYLSLVKNFLQKENPRKLVQFSRVQRLLIMKAITPEQWTKLVSELFSRNPTLLKATAALTKISANAKDPKDHLAWRVASLTTKSASPSQKSPSPSSAKSVARDQTRPPSLTSVTPTNNGGAKSFSFCTSAVSTELCGTTTAKTENYGMAGY